MSRFFSLLALSITLFSGCAPLHFLPGVPTNTPVPRPTLAPTPTSPPTLSATPDAARTAPVIPPTPSPSATPTQFSASNDPVLIGAGDIADCSSKGDEATAKLVDAISGTVFTLGDNVYPSGKLQQFQDCYEPSWGRFKERTLPIPGNHDYLTGGARGYFAYFGKSAGDPAQGYYSYDVGAWHIVALNSEIDTGENSAQVKWLRADLQAHPTQCTLAMFHRPLFTSGPHGYDGSGNKTRPLWGVLYENNADLILNGHDHDYERFAPQDPQGKADPQRGIREIVVGTGGAPLYIFGKIKPNSQTHSAGLFGVLKLTLHPTSYDWQFIPAIPLTFLDSGHGECH